MSQGESNVVEVYSMQRETISQRPAAGPQQSTATTPGLGARQSRAGAAETLSSVQNETDILSFWT